MGTASLDMFVGESRYGGRTEGALVHSIRCIPNYVVIRGDMPIGCWVCAGNAASKDDES